MSEPRLVPSRHHVPQCVYWSQDHKLNPTAHLICLFDWYRYALRIDAELIAHVILQPELGTNYLVTDFRVKTYRKTLLLVFVFIGTLLQRLVLPPLEVRNLSFCAFFHNTLIPYYQHTSQHTHL